MRTKYFLVSCIFFILFSCNAQEKQNDDIVKYFHKEEKISFDVDDKIILSFYLIPNVGEFTIYYIPKLKSDIDYFKNFEKNNQLKPLYNELYDYHYFSDADNEKIDKILKEKIKDEKKWGRIGVFVPIKYIEIDSEEEYSKSFPFVRKYYQKKNEKWEFLFEKKVKNADGSMYYQSKEYINSLLLQKK
ncbi:hypothetical protein [Capnocytophaga catalasegens]|uniref:Lipoprotein n=1 Tax=Capnocytophaga catalasegens TaxID=1004260 RepID=A0AAV5AYT5_9FLAO|nr:hypothetical protein [Capnocytophaga catalasegens]GIZ16647.1 hypothetical protein RCZ03_26470 [Capnocytophaga catalasegens]GJM51675.1 hypothetical protein RCZ15_26480 [Capnocytophaga catalasegens]GJM54190.1 hypothetical protein RCZ16_25060 [Capnocytophaga catalasegens]